MVYKLLMDMELIPHRKSRAKISQEEVTSLFMQGTSPMEISRVLGMHCGVVYKYLERSKLWKIDHDTREKNLSRIPEQQIIKDYLSGTKGTDIARKYGIHNTTVYNVLKRNSIDRRDSRKERRKDLPYKEIIRLYTKEKMSGETLAKIYGASVPTILKTIRRHGGKVRPQGSPLSLPSKKIAALYEDKKWSVLRIARKYKCDPEAIRARLVAEEVEFRKHVVVNEPEAVAAYSAGETAPTIARKAGCSVSHVYKILRKHGVHIRSKISGPLPAKEVVALYRSGVGSCTISQRFGCSYQRILDCLRKNGVKILPAGRAFDLPNEDIRYLYENDNWACARIGDYYGCHESVIMNRLHAMGVRMKRPGEWPANSPQARVIRLRVDGRRIRIHSKWEAHMYMLLHKLFGEDVLYQGEFGERAAFATKRIHLRRRIPTAYGSNVYHWTPDFVIPSQKLIIEVKGHPKARETWDSVVLPAIRRSRARLKGWKVLAVYTNPAKFARVGSLDDLCAHCTQIQ
jgi:DNA invertase Pin-like site-specific DNA recombinase